MKARDIGIFHHRLVVRGNSQPVAGFIARSRAISVNDGAGVIPLSLNAHVPQPDDASEVQRDIQEMARQSAESWAGGRNNPPGQQVLPRPGAFRGFHVGGLPPRDGALKMPATARTLLPGLSACATQERLGCTPAGIWRMFRWGTDRDAIFGAGESGSLVGQDVPAVPRGGQAPGWVLPRRHLASITFTTVRGPVEPWFGEVAQANPVLEFSLAWADVSADKAVVLVARQGRLDSRAEMRASAVLSAEGAWF